MLAKKKTVKENCWLIFLCPQVTKCVGGHSPVQALQQTPGVCSDETSARVSSQTRYVCRPTAVFPVSGRARGERSQNNTFSSVVSSLADIPVFPTITATVTFQEFRYDEFEESIFVIPAEYKEDPSRFPDLWPVTASDIKRETTSKQTCLGGGKQKWGILYCFIPINMIF